MIDFSRWEQVLSVTSTHEQVPCRKSCRCPTGELRWWQPIPTVVTLLRHDHVELDRGGGRRRFCLGRLLPSAYRRVRGDHYDERELAARYH